MNINPALSTTQRQIIVTKPHWLKRRFQFIENDNAVGEMIFTKYFALSNKSALFGEEWTITRSGFWRNIFEFKAGQRPFAKFTMKPAHSGKIDWLSPDGKRYSFRRVKWWKQRFSWYDEHDEPILEIRNDHSFSRKQAHIDIFKAGTPDLVPMVLMAWLSLLIHQTRSSSAST